MKTLTFTYTKDDGSVSDRTLLAITSPSDSYTGIDVTSLEPNVGASFIAAVEAAHDTFVEEMRALQIKYDLKHNFRKFIPSKMSEIDEI